MENLYRPVSGAAAALAGWFAPIVPLVACVQRRGEVFVGKVGMVAGEQPFEERVAPDDERQQRYLSEITRYNLTHID